MKPLGIAIIVQDDFETTLKWAKKTGFSNCQLQIWNMGYLNRDHAAYVKGLLEKYEMKLPAYGAAGTVLSNGILQKDRQSWASCLRNTGHPGQRIFWTVLPMPESWG